MKTWFYSINLIRRDNLAFLLSITNKTVLWSVFVWYT